MGSTKVERRCQWIEASLRFVGHFGIAEKKVYREHFNLTDGMVSRDQDVFRRLFNEACNSDAVIKVHGRLRPADGATFPVEPVFQPLPRMTQWLEDVLGTRFEIVPAIRRTEPSHATLRVVMRALDAKRPLRFLYQPRRGAAKVRLVSPHVIVHIVGRLHLRGWDHERNAARDFILTRILSIEQVSQLQGFVGQEHDHDWANQVYLDVSLREGEVLAAVQPDYNLDEFGHGMRQLRKAHARYLTDDDTLDTERLLRAPVAIRLRERN